jgi:uncharacterized membrane protein YqjE
MPTRAGDRDGVGSAARRVADHAKNLVGLELELAGLELRRKAISLGLGAVLVATAAIFGLFALGFLLATLAAALATALAVWLALLLVSVLLLVTVGALGLIGLRQIRSASPPVPEQAIAEARRTTEVLRSNGDHR